jgi:putative endonuclease
MSADPRQELGRRGEQVAVEHLLRRGFDIIERNYRTRWGELDIVAYDGSALIFCEVKARRMPTRGGPPARAGQPLDAVNGAKRTQLRKMAGRWLIERRERPFAEELRFDAIGVSFDAGGDLVGLEHIEHAF